MKNIAINITSDLGMECSGIGHYLDEYISVEIDDLFAERLMSLSSDHPSLDKSTIEEKDPELAKEIDKEAYKALHDLMVIQGWEEYGWQACANYIYDLIEEDLNNGSLVFEYPDDIDEEEDYGIEDACQDAWEEMENEKREQMDTHSLARYLEERYGLQIDISDMVYNWTII